MAGECAAWLEKRTLFARTVTIKVRFKREGGSAAVMEIANSLGTDAPGDEGLRRDGHDAQSTGLGEQLLSAFSQQIGGQLQRTVTTAEFLLSVRFDVRHVTEAENRAKQV